MSKIISFEDPQLGTLYIEVEEDTRSGGMVKAGDNDKTPRKFEDALQSIKGVVGKIFSYIVSIPERPDEVECKIGVKFSAEAGIVIAKAATEGNLELTLKWKKDANA